MKHETTEIADASTPVLVLRPYHHGALGIFRSLGRLGVAVYAVEDGESAPPLRSRYCRGVFHCDLRHASPQDSVAALLGIANRFGRRPILIPTCDATAILVQEASGELQAAYQFPALPKGLARRLCSKKELYFLCRERGFPTPETAFPQSRRDVLQFLEKAIFPVLLKGIDGCRLREKSGVRMCIVHTPEELLKFYDETEDPAQPNLMLQEYIPGKADSVWMFNGYFNEKSECLAGFTGKKLRQCPAYTGITSLGICLRNETVDQSIRSLLGSLHYRGMVDIGCRYDARDGQYKLLDVNPRVGCTFRLFVDPAGMDVVRACYLDLTGQPVHAEPAAEGRKWLVESQDLMALPRYLGDREITVGEWVRSLWGVRETAWFHWRDPSPFWTLCVGFLRSLCRSLFRRNLAHRPDVVRPSMVSGNPSSKSAT
jgi:D-aspartate ligase